MTKQTNCTFHQIFEKREENNKKKKKKKKKKMKRKEKDKKGRPPHNYELCKPRIMRIIS